MTNNIENLVLEQLRGLRNQIETFQTEMHDEFRDVKQRLQHVEVSVLAVRRDGISASDDIARQQVSIDVLVERIRRLEKRVGLVDSEH